MAFILLIVLSDVLKAQLTMSRYPSLPDVTRAFLEPAQKDASALVSTLERLLLQAQAALDVFDAARHEMSLAKRPEPRSMPGQPGFSDRMDRLRAVLPELQARQFMAAKAFLATIVRLGRTLDALAELASAEFSAAASEYRAAFPELREVRNSAEHSEDRVRLLRTGNKKIVPAFPGNLFIDGLIETQFTTLLANGIHGSFDITAATLALVDGIVRRPLARIAAKIERDEAKARAERLSQM